MTIAQVEGYATSITSKYLGGLWCYNNVKDIKNALRELTLADPEIDDAMAEEYHRNSRNSLYMDHMNRLYKVWSE